ncbi:MAG TPA: hypothetical protein VFM24_01830 [Nitrospira sp.]|nr:hypothetical protein [Nitrospira sp.]
MPLSCPDCFGVLRCEREGKHGHLLYRCQIDHRYTIASLLEAKEDQLERTLWSASLLLKQLTYAYEDLLSEMPERKGAAPKRLRLRMNEARKQSLEIRAMIENAHVVD